MGAWGKGTFDNDSGADFAHAFDELDREGGIELIAEAIDGVLYEEQEGYLDSDFAVDALVACEAIARLAGQGGEQSAYSESLDTWVAEHPGPVDKGLAKRAIMAIERIMADDSELPELWENDPEWLAEMENLKRRVAAAAT